jgi:lipopolysaccharide biosynthesis protein
MTTALIFVIALALLTVVAFVVALRGRAKKAEIYPLDLDAFHSLLDRQDENYLRQKLPRREFSRIKRKRVSVIWKYVNRISNNSAVVLKDAGMARSNPDPQVAEAALQIVDLASQIRTGCLISFSKLAVEFMFPSMQLTPAVLVPKYESLRENVARLGSLHPRDVPALPYSI